MSDSTRDYLRWILSVDGARRVEYVGQEPSFVTNASVAAFSVAMEVMFGENATPEQITDFVTRIRTRWVKPEALNPILAERVIKTMFEDDSDVLDELPLTEIVRINTVLAAAVLRERHIEGDQLEEFLDEVEELMNEPLEVDS